jgi:type II secretory pathway component GspD/PulD (secretin)
LKSLKTKGWEYFPLVATAILLATAALAQEPPTPDSVTADSLPARIDSVNTADDPLKRALERMSPLDAPDRVSLADGDCLVTNVFYDTDIREVLNSIASQCQVTIMFDETVAGILTMELNNVPIEEALRRVLQPYGLTYRWMGEYYLVGAPRPDNPSFPLLAETKLYRPNFIKAEDVPLMLSSYYQPYLRVNRETNTVTLTGSPELIKRMKQDLQEVDQPPRQVLIEALVTETSTDVGLELGVLWDIQASQGRDSLRVSSYPPSLNGDSILFEPSPDGFSMFFDRVGIHSSDWLAEFRVKLAALLDDGEASIRANPRIATLEGKKARIFIGREEYFSILTGSVTFNYAQLEVIKTGISLTITPYVSEDGFITLEVEPEVSDVVGSGSTGLPVTNKRSVVTKVRVREGETVVIGGLFVEYAVRVERKVPILGSIPILGYLFKHTSNQVRNGEVMVLITPRLWEGDVQKEGIAADTISYFHQE